MAGPAALPRFRRPANHAGMTLETTENLPRRWREEWERARPWGAGATGRTAAAASESDAAAVLQRLDSTIRLEPVNARDQQVGAVLVAQARGG